MEGLKIISCNVNGLADSKKRRQVFNYLRQKEVDIVYMQETHSTKNSKNMWRNLWGGKIIFSHGEPNARGTAILFAKNVDVKITKEYVDKKGRQAFCIIEYNEQKIALCNVYAPNEDDPEFFVEIVEKLANIEVDHIVWGGDLNTYLTENDKKGGKSIKNLPRATNVINSFLEEYAWTDVWRYFNRDKFQFTWKRNKPKPIYSRLDYFLMPEGSIDYVNECEIWPGFLSDHSFVYMKLKFEKGLRGPGLWKMNMTHLTSKEFVDQVNEIIARSDARYKKVTQLNVGNI